jgi:hypothetical protein
MKKTLIGLGMIFVGSTVMFIGYDVYMGRFEA